MLGKEGKFEAKNLLTYILTDLFIILPVLSSIPEAYGAIDSQNLMQLCTL